MARQMIRDQHKDIVELGLDPKNPELERVFVAGFKAAVEQGARIAFRDEYQNELVLLSDLQKLLEPK